jgi:hypothetical protein
LNNPYNSPGLRQTDPGAISSLVVGVVGHALLVLGVIFGPIAIGLGSAAKKRIVSSGGALEGAGLAQAGFILGITATAIGAVSLILFFGPMAFYG